MPLKQKISLIIIGLLIVCPLHSAHAKTHHVKHHKKSQNHAAVDRTAGYADIVIDAESGQILHEENANSLRHPASLTKMMTLYLTFQAIESGRLGINQYLPVSTNASEQPPSKLGLHPGQRIRVEDAILGIVTESANDAAMVMGEWLGGNAQNFAQMMTRQAKALGMNHTHFENPNGLPDPQQVTTARDMAVLGQSLLYHFPKFYPYFSRDSFTYAGVLHHNHNHLMERYDGMDGIKTGYIRASGFNLVASVKRGDTRLIGVVFGGRSAIARDNRMAILLDQSFSALADNKEDKDSDHVVNSNTAMSTKGDINEAEGDSSDQNVNEDGDYVALANKGAPSVIQHRAALAAAPVKSNDVTGDNWGVQIGAYKSEKAGETALLRLSQEMPQLLGAAKPMVEKVTSGNKIMYRARLMSIDPKTAQAVCAYMLQNKRSCLTVGP